MIFAPVINSFNSSGVMEQMISGPCLSFVSVKCLSRIDAPSATDARHGKFVNEWSDITQELLDKTIIEFKNKTFNYDKLSLQYWTKQFTL